MGRFRLIIVIHFDCKTYFVLNNYFIQDFSLTINNNHFHRYVGKEDSTNMVMVDIKLLSGFVPEPESLRMVGKCSYIIGQCGDFHARVFFLINPLNDLSPSQLKSALLVDRVEHNDDHIIIYLKPVSKPTCNINTYCNIYQK